MTSDLTIPLSILTTVEPMPTVELLSPSDNSSAVPPLASRSTPTTPRMLHVGNHFLNLATSPVAALEKCASENCLTSGLNLNCRSTPKSDATTTTGSSKSDGHISSKCEQRNEENDKVKQEIVRDEDGERMTGVKSGGGGATTAIAPEGLILPKRLPNPCIESTDRQRLHKELMFNQKLGKNVLNQKSELQKAMEKHKENQHRKELEQQKLENMTPFEKVIEQRAKRLEILEKDPPEKDLSPKENEFLQVHAKLRARMDAK